MPTIILRSNSRHKWPNSQPSLSRLSRNMFNICNIRPQRWRHSVWFSRSCKTRRYPRTTKVFLHPPLLLTNSTF